MSETPPASTPTPESALPGRGMFLLRAFWVALRLVLVIYLGEQGAKFFYQGF